MDTQRSNNEQHLLQSVASGNSSALTELMETYGNLTYNFIRRYCQDPEISKEIMQDIFTEIWLTREGLVNVRNFKAYLFVLTRNYAIDTIRKLVREKKKQLQYEQNQWTDNSTEELSTEAEWKLRIIKRAVASLPPQQQQAWVLSRMEGLTYAEIAQQMGLSKETVKKYLQYATSSVIEYVKKRTDVLLLLLVWDNL